MVAAAPDDKPATLRLVGAKQPIIAMSGASVLVMPNTANIYGGFIVNPATALSQGLPYPEILYVSIVGPATLGESATTTALYPGGTFTIPGGVNVWANAVSTGHRFSAMFGIPVEATPPKAVTSVEGWPPTRPTGLTHVLYAYVYQEYSDDDDVQAFFAAINDMQTDYVDTFNAIQLPIYPNPVLVGPLADWAIEGVYGYKRPTLFTQRHHPIGPLNTYTLNSLPALNMLRRQAPTDVHVANDDLYKRCATWHLQKGDGQYFGVRWLKRRVWRFLIGANGSSPHIDSTDRVSVTFGDDYDVTIRIIMGKRTITGGAMPNRFGPNGVIDNKRRGPSGLNPVPLNSIFSVFESYPPLQYASQFQEAVAAGILELPFQFSFNVVLE